MKIECYKCKHIVEIPDEDMRRLHREELLREIKEILSTMEVHNR